MTAPRLILRAHRPQLERDTPLVAIAVARQVVEEVSLWLDVPLPKRYATGLALRAKFTYAHSPSFREKLRCPGSAGRDLLYLFMRHWLAGRFHAERSDLYAQLPVGFRTGAPLPERPAAASVSADDGYLSNDARLLFAF